jgi:CRP-like cAMP-binding protein
LSIGKPLNADKFIAGHQMFSLLSAATADVGIRSVEFERKATIFSQGDAAKNVMYIERGAVKLSVVNGVGKEAVVAMLGPGDFFGEGCLAGQRICIATATAMIPTVVLAIAKDEMNRVLHTEHAFSDRFIKHMLSRNIRIEEDLIDQLFNSTEKRLARTLLLLARYGKNDPAATAVAQCIARNVGGNHRYHAVASQAKTGGRSLPFSRANGFAFSSEHWLR